MASRRYDRTRRDEAMAATRARIVAAVAELHAEVGPSRTTYAMIARRADVAIPTVYKHFPTLANLFAACIGHVSAQVPVLTVEEIARHPDAVTRLAALTRALFERHRHFAPWLRWSRGAAHLLPDMAVYFTKMRERHLRLIVEALRPAYASRPPAELVAVVEVLTGFGAWQTLTAENRLGQDDAVAAVAETLAATLSPATAPPLRRASRARRAAASGTRG
jgi:AcrR family transcriptional regulator